MSRDGETMTIAASGGNEAGTTATVSVVIPLYNKGSYVERAILSVLNQTCPALEIIVVDDDSTDDGPERVARLALVNGAVSLVRQKNRGPGAARNAGLKMAKGKYIAFLDADDEWMPTFVEAGLSLLEDAEADAAAVCTGCISTPYMRSTSFEYPDGVYEIMGDMDIKQVEDLFLFRSTPSFMIMKSEVVRKWGGFFDRYKCLGGEDTYLSLKLWFNERIGIIKTPLTVYHTEASDLSGRGYHPHKQTAPYLTYPDEIIASCPPDKRRLLKALLSKLAMRRAENLAKFGRGREARELMNRFEGMGRVRLSRKVRLKLLVMTSPVLPAVRRIWNIGKSLTGIRREWY